MYVRLVSLGLVLFFWQTVRAASDAPDPAGPFKELKFRSIGPAAGGRICRACGIPGNPFIYYAATAASGVWKTSDGGLSWKPIFDDQPTSTIGAIAVAPSDPNVIYAGSGEANIRGNVTPGCGIFKSIDGGKTWKHLWQQRGQVGHMIVHPHNPNVAFAAVLGSAFGPNPQRGVYRTTDGGQTWLQVLKKDADTGAIDVCFDLNNPHILFAALWQARRYPWGMTSGGPGSGLYRSDDGGDTWKQLAEKGLPEGPWGRIGVAVAPSDGRRVYALIEAEKGGLYRSDDGGDKWRLVHGQRPIRMRPWYFSTVHVDPANADVVWCPNVRLLKSIDGGHTFKQVKGPHHVDHHDLWIDPKNPKRLIDSNDGGVDISTNGGDSWYAPPLPISQFYRINVDNRLPYHVSGTMQDLGTASGPSNSLCSDGILLQHWHYVGGGETGHTMPDPADPNIVYAGEYGGYLSRYDHRTRQAQNIGIYPVVTSGKSAQQLRYRFQWTAPVLISPHDPKVVYHAANVLFKTSDGGKSWQKISPDLTRNDPGKQQWSGGPITGDNTGAEYYCTIFAIAESPLQAGVLWAGSDDGLLHVSRDGGKNWINVTKNIPGLPEWGTIICIEPSPRDAGTAYVVIDAHRLDDNRPYLWRLSDFGQTWTSLADRLPQDQYLQVVRADPAVAGLLYVGGAHGLHLSRDDGAAWERLKLNLPTVAVSDLKVKNHDLVVGTNGRSIWILDDLTPLRQWSSKLTGPHLFPVLPAIRWRYNGEGYGFDDRLPGANPLRGAILNYHLDHKAKSTITLDILDAKGHKVQTLTSKEFKPDYPEDAPDAPWHIFKKTVLPNQPGVNRVAWDLTYQGARRIPKAMNDGGEPRGGPLVLPGTYTLKLTVDGQVRTGTVDVRPDPRVKTSARDLEDQLRLILKLRDHINGLVDMVQEARSLRQQIKNRSALLKSQARAKNLIGASQQFLAKLDLLEAKLHNPKAQVSYDILAQKGGARLYSQLTGLYETLQHSDGPVSQGIREVYEENLKELRELEVEWQELTKELGRLNETARQMNLPTVVVP